jgi:hypothetical protein
MMKLNKFSNWATAIYTVVMLTFLVGCEKPGELTITASAAKTEKAPDEIKDQYKITDAESPKVIRPPDRVKNTTILVSDVDGCKTYFVEGEVNFFNKHSGKWNHDWYKTYFTKCIDDSTVVNEWDTKHGKTTVQNLTPTIKGK